MVVFVVVTKMIYLYVFYFLYYIVYQYYVLLHESCEDRANSNLSQEETRTERGVTKDILISFYINIMHRFVPDCAFLSQAKASSCLKKWSTTTTVS